VAPSFTQQPASQTNYVTGSVTLAAAATGAGPLGYQWYYNTNMAVAGATSPTLVLNNLATTNAGKYSLVVTNYGGSVTSSAAALTVLPLPRPLITGVRWSGSGLVLSGTNGMAAGNVFYTLASTNLAQPLTNWMVVGTNYFGPGGGFGVTNVPGGNVARMYFILWLP
jgi:hypothetical protein